MEEIVLLSVLLQAQSADALLGIGKLCFISALPQIKSANTLPEMWKIVFFISTASGSIRALRSGEILLQEVADMRLHDLKCHVIHAAVYDDVRITPRRLDVEIMHRLDCA